MKEKQSLSFYSYTQDIDMQDTKTRLIAPREISNPSNDRDTLLH